MRHDELSDHVLEQIQSVLPGYHPDKLVIGFSGGLDSTVLVHLLSGIQPSLAPISLVVVHVNHGVNPRASHWQHHCQSFCQHLKLEFKTVSYALENVNNDREAAYRRARYQAFAQEMSSGSFLLTAHHQQDQVETVLFHLFRGGGVAGLRGILPLREFASGYQLRPLLAVSPGSLLDYAQHYDLSWIDDPSNQDLSFDRNYLRHQVLPAIEKRWPSVQSSIARSAGLFVAADDVIKQTALEDIDNVSVDHFPGVIKDFYRSVLDISAINKLSYNRRMNLLKHWVATFTLTGLGERQLKRIQLDLCQQPASGGLVAAGGVEIRVFRGFLYLLDKLPVERSPKVEILINNRFRFPELQLKLDIETDLDRPYTFMLRQGGETLRLNNQRKSLKSVFQENRVPPWERAIIPIILQDNQIAAVAGVAVADRSRIRSTCLCRYSTER